MASPLFVSTSSEKPSKLTISFAADPVGSLGAQLTNLDKGLTEDMFYPGYACIGRLVDGDTIARRCGVSVGDCVVAVNSLGFRRFPPDYSDEELDNVTTNMEQFSITEEEDGENSRVLTGAKPGEAYKTLLGKIKEVKQAASSPLVLSLERYGWDARCNAWPRFLAARDGNVPEAMMMIQQHESWRDATFPIDLTREGIQGVLKSKAVSEIDIPNMDATKNTPPTVYVDFGQLQALNHTPQDVVDSFILLTETLLSRSFDPRQPKTCQFIDLSNVKVTAGFRVDILKQVYASFEPNYPETLHKMVMYPVSKMVKRTSGMILSFVNEKTQKKFVITDDLDVVCKELGWDKADVEVCGGISQFMHKHETPGSNLIF